MQLAVVDPADRNDELVAHSASERTRLGKGQVMRIGWHTAAHKARLPQYEIPVVLIAQPNRLAQSMDHVAGDCFLARLEALLSATSIWPGDGHCSILTESMRPPDSGKTVRYPLGVEVPSEARHNAVIADGGEPLLKALLDHFGVWRGQGVFGRQIPLRPKSRFIRRIYSGQLLDQAFAKACG